MKKNTITFKLPRTSLIADRNNELVVRLIEHPEVIGIMCHGSFSDNAKHESDAGSDLDLTVIYDSELLPNGTPHVDWANFKSYQAMSDGQPLEVDLYLFNINDETPWDIRTCEGYSGSSTLVFDRDGRCQEWLNRKIELLPETREQNIRSLMFSIRKLFNLFPRIKEPIDKRLAIATMVKFLEEAIYWLNWEYPADVKWRMSLMNGLSWKPAHQFEEFALASQTKNLEVAISTIKKLISIINEQLETEGLSVDFATPMPSKTKESTTPSRRLQLERLWTRLDNYSEHTPRKCIKRLLPCNAHDILWSGVNNAIDLIYVLNNEPIPTVNKFAGLSKLKWFPRETISLIYRAASVRDYNSSSAAEERADALRELFNRLTVKVTEEGMFDMGSLYSNNFINQPLFGDNAIFTHMFREGGYINRQQPKDTYAVRLLRRVSLSTSFEENMLWGCCCQYFISSDEELSGLTVKTELNPVYKAVLAKVIPQLSNSK